MLFLDHAGWLDSDGEFRSAELVDLRVKMTIQLQGSAAPLLGSPTFVDDIITNVKRDEPPSAASLNPRRTTRSMQRTAPPGRPSELCGHLRTLGQPE